MFSSAKANGVVRESLSVLSLVSRAGPSRLGGSGRRMWDPSSCQAEGVVCRLMLVSRSRLFLLSGRRGGKGIRRLRCGAGLSRGASAADDACPEGGGRSDGRDC